MSIVAAVLVVFVALSHVGFLVLEMFYWDHPVGRKVFRMTPEQSAMSKVLAANQGLYNGFLAAGLFWGQFSSQPQVTLFFLGCVVVAGIYGALTVKKTIFFTQGMPALLASAAVLLAS